MPSLSAHKGALEGFEISRKDAEDMIMAARVLPAGSRRRTWRRCGRAGGGSGCGRGWQGGRGRTRDAKV